MFSHRIEFFAFFGFQVWIDASWLLAGALVALAGAKFRSPMGARWSGIEARRPQRAGFSSDRTPQQF